MAPVHVPLLEGTASVTRAMLPWPEKSCSSSWTHSTDDKDRRLVQAAATSGFQNAI